MKQPIAGLKGIKPRLEKPNGKLSRKSAETRLRVPGFTAIKRCSCGTTVKRCCLPSHEASSSRKSW